MKEDTVKKGPGNASATAESENAGEVPQAEKRKLKKRGRTKRRRRVVSGETTPRSKTGGSADYPRHPAQKALRIPRAILEQNAGKPCTDKEAARFLGIGYHGPFTVELRSAIKYGYLSRPQPGTVELTDLGKRVLRPHLKTR